MSMRKTEVPHHSPEQIRGYMDEALAIVRDLDVDDDLAAIAFSKAIDLLAAKQLFFEQVSMGTVLPRMDIPRG